MLTTKFRRVSASLLLLLLLSCGKTTTAPAPPVVAPAATTFLNPLLSSGPDPWVVRKDGFYYYLNTTGNDVRIRKTARMSQLGSAPSQVVWRPSGGANSRDVWAPELHFLDGKWYIYLTAGPGNCCGGQRLWVLENPAADPTTGTWTEKGRIFNPTEDFWAIDGTVLELAGKRYLLWSGHQDASSDVQRLYISQMSNPWALTGPRVELSSPQYSWEQAGPVPVNEGPQVLQHDGNTFLVYSASHCNTDDYALGMLRLRPAADPLDRTAWSKSAIPVFSQNPANGAFGPGHNSFFTSPDGTESWLLYHANNLPGQGCGDARTPRIQKFTWNPDGTPNFGQPQPINVALPRPSGE